MSSSQPTSRVPASQVYGSATRNSKVNNSMRGNQGLVAPPNSNSGTGPRSRPPTEPSLAASGGVRAAQVPAEQHPANGFNVQQQQLRLAQPSTSSRNTAPRTGTSLESDSPADERIDVEAGLSEDDNNATRATLLWNQIWPPSRVVAEKEEEQGADRTMANIAYVFLFCCFLAAAGYTIYDLVAKKPATAFTSEYKDDEFPFPTVTVCGSGFTGRTHTMPKFLCEIVDFSQTPAEYSECASKIVDELQEGYLFSNEPGEDVMIGPCVMYNYNEPHQMASKDNRINMELSWDAVISESDPSGSFCTRCKPGQVIVPSITMLISQSDPTTTGYKDQEWRTQSFPAYGYTDLVVSMTETAFLNGYVGKKYTVEAPTYFPWDGNDRNSTLSLINIQSSEAGVLYLTETWTFSTTVVIGAIAGLFAYVAIMFSLCFVSDENKPFLLRRIKDPKAFKEQAKLVASALKESSKD